MNKIERNLSLVAAVITIVNFIVVMPGTISSGPWIPLDIVKAISIPTKVVLVTILEISLAYAFGRIFSLACKLDDVTLFVCFFVTAILSAWISIFNIESLLIGRTVVGFLEHLGLFILLLIAWMVAAVMISGHIEKDHGDNAQSQEHSTAGVIVQGLAYVFIFSSLIFR